MELIWQGTKQAILLLVRGDPEVLRIALLSLQVSGSATMLSLLVGIPLGTVLALTRFPGRNFAMSLVNGGRGPPPVVVGLFVSIFLWRSGPLGFLELLYTPTAIVIAQLVIAGPIVTGLTMTAVQQVNPRARLPLLAAVMAGFGAVISEIGASIMVGGNIYRQTRVLTTATVLETSKGNFEMAIALSLLLLLLTFAVNWALTWIQQGGRAS